jgi:hypothetical protein
VLASARQSSPLPLRGEEHTAQVIGGATAGPDSMSCSGPEIVQDAQRYLGRISAIR